MTIDPQTFGALKYRSIGPHRGGRVVAVTGVPGDRNTYYFGSTGGGVWKSDDAGVSWLNVSDGFFKWASVGAIQVAPSDPNVIYVGMGETTIRGNVSRGDGVYKSTDAGRTWKHIGLADTRNIGEIAIHPDNPDLVYVAAFGHVWNRNEERGLYRSSDGGDTWEKILYVSDKAGANDIAMDPNNPRILYVVAWEADRGPYYLSSGGEDSGLYRSYDGGDTWEEITHNTGLPQGDIVGKIGITASAARPGRLYAIVEAEDGAVFTSSDYGETWTRGSEDTNLRQRAWYYHHIYADPQDPDTVWVLNVEMWKSIDAGKTFEFVPAPHGDNHDLWINPDDADNMILGNDGGALVTFNGGQGWSSIYNQPTGEFYHLTTDTAFPYRVYGAQQDNTTMSIPSRSSNAAIITPDWREVGGGESGYIAVDPRDPNVVYAGTMMGMTTRYDIASRHRKDVTAWPEMMFGHGAKDLKYRWQWTSPLQLSTHDPDVLYSAGNHVWRSTTEGSSWEQASPDLTRADPETLESSGGPITKDNTGAETYATVFALAESPLEEGVLWSGSDDGLIYVTRDNGENWTSVNPPELPDWALISIIEASPHQAGKAYVAATRYKSGDERPYLYKTSDYGATWEEIIDGIPADDFTRAIREDPVREGLLFAGTERGVYVSFDDGGEWQPLQQNLPVVPIHDLLVHGDSLVLATHGRSFWILDDISALRQVDADTVEESIHLFQPAPTVRLLGAGDFGPHRPRPGKNYTFAAGMMTTYLYKENDDNTNETFFIDAGNNPPNGVIFHYWLKDGSSDEVTLTILDADGNTIRTFSSEKSDNEQKKDPLLHKSAGAHTFVWDMSYEPSTPLDDPVPLGFGASGGGPRAVAGSYQVQLSAGGDTVSQSFEIVADPRVNATREDVRAQFDLQIQVRDKMSELNEAVNAIRKVRSQAESWAGRTDDEAIKEAAKGLDEKLLAVEGELIQYRAKSPQDSLNFPSKLNVQLAGVAGSAGTAEGRPNEQTYAVYEDVAARIDAQLEQYQEIIANDLPAFNKLIDESDIDPVSV